MFPPPEDGAPPDEEDTYAALSGSLALSLVGHRLSRCWWMLRGWPARLVLCLGGDDLAKLVIALFRRDYDNFMELKRDIRVAGAKEIVDRSIFNLKVVMQDVLILQSKGWKFDAEYREHLVKVNSRIISSQVCEDGFNRQKNWKKHPNRRGLVHGTYEALIKTKVADEVHHYTQPPPCATAVSRESDLRHEFYPQLSDMPKELFPIVSFDKKPKWYSSTGDSYTKPFADLNLLDFALRHGLKNNISDAWLGQIFDATHQILVRHRHVPGQISRWFFPMLHVPGSSNFLWPADDCRLDGGNLQCFSPLSHAVRAQW